MKTIYYQGKDPDNSFYYKILSRKKSDKVLIVASKDIDFKQSRYLIVSKKALEE